MSSRPAIASAQPRLTELAHGWRAASALGDGASAVHSLLAFLDKGEWA